MKRIAALVMVLILAVPAPALALPAPADGPSPTGAPAAIDDDEESNTTTRLTLSGDVTAATAKPSADIAQVVGGADDTLDARFRSRAGNASVRAAGSAAARVAAAEAMLDDIEDRTDRLQRTERAAVRSYANGTTSATELLRTLASVHSSAEALDQTLYAHGRLSASIDGYDASERRGEIRTRLTMLRSPTRERVGAAFAGTGGVDDATQVAATDSGVVVGTLSDGQYYREAVRFDNRDDNTTDTFDDDLAAVLDYARTDLYTWATENRQGNLALSGTYDGQYRLVIPHEHGTLTIYLDGTTRAVFREFQALETDRLPRRTAVTETEGDLSMRVERTPGDGPVRLNVTDSAGEPVDAVVRINGERVGTTGGDGHLWTLPPRSYYLASVTADGTTLNATVGA